MLGLSDLETAGETLRFFNEVRKHALLRGRRVSFDLRQVTKISADVVLLFAAELARLRFLRGKDAVTGISPVDPTARMMLHAMGFFELLGLRDGGFEHLVRPLVIIASERTLDGEVPRRIAGEFARALGLDEGRARRVEVALKEALENSSEHAYDPQFELDYPAERGRWWVCAVAFKDVQTAYLVACDLGATIQRTIEQTARKRSTLDALRAFMRSEGVQSEPERLLEAAFEPEVTCRPDSRGGEGLGKMLALLQEFDEGAMAVWSGSAHATLTAGADRVATHHLPSRMPGTYVVWMVKQGAAK